MKPLRATDNRGDWVRGNIRPGREIARADTHGRPVKLGVVLLVLDAGGGRFRAVTDRGTVPFRRGQRLWSRNVRNMTGGAK